MYRYCCGLLNLTGINFGGDLIVQVKKKYEHFASIQSRDSTVLRYFARIYFREIA